MAARCKKEDIMECAKKILKKDCIEDVSIEHQKSSDKRVKFQLGIHDSISDRKYAIMANNPEDVESLLPKLIKVLISQR